MVALVLGLRCLLVACGSDSYSGTWKSLPDGATVHIEKSGDGWTTTWEYESSASPGENAVEKDGKLVTIQSGRFQ
jgi:hypothetical protein